MSDIIVFFIFTSRLCPFSMTARQMYLLMTGKSGAVQHLKFFNKMNAKGDKITDYTGTQKNTIMYLVRR